MGYEVHITRSDDWPGAAQHPILLDEWVEVVNSDASLQLTDESETVCVIWLDHHDKPQFWFTDGQITKKHPDERTLQKMAEIAARLNARVIDDDGAEYGEEQDLETAEDTERMGNRPWWQKFLKR